MTGEGRVLHEGAGFGEPGGGGHGDGSQGDLGELGEVEQPVGVAVGHAAGGHLGGVVTYEGDDGEAESGTSMGISAFPDPAGCLRGAHLVQSHAAGLDALTGVDVGGRLGLGDGRAA